MRVINADLAQEIADRELSAQEAGAVQFVLSHTPTIEAVPVVHGRWVRSEQSVRWLKCSNCDGWITKPSADTPSYNYCPNCGAKMSMDT